MTANLNSTVPIIESYVQLRRSLATLWAAKTKDLDLGQNQISVLYRLLQSDATMGELVEHAFSDKASMSRTISALVDQGFVRRKEDPNDRRIIRIELTAKGKEKAQIAKKIRSEIERKLEVALKPEERAQFTTLTEKIVRNLQDL